MMAEQLDRLIADHGIRTVRLMACLPDGRLIGKYIAAAHLAEMLPGLPNVADIMYALDVDNEPNIMSPSTWRGDLAELYLEPDFDTLVVDPRLPEMASVLCSFVLGDDVGDRLGIGASHAGTSTDSALSRTRRISSRQPSSSGKFCSRSTKTASTRSPACSSENR